MERNTKILLGLGGGGCVVLLVLLAGGLVVAGLMVGELPDVEPAVSEHTEEAAPPGSIVVEGEPAVGAMAPRSIVDRVNAFMRDGFSVDVAYTARSQAHSGAFFVAGRIRGPGAQEDDVGVWLVSGSLEEPGITMSVNELAKIASVAPDGSATEVEVTMLDPPAGELRDYARSQVR